MPRQVMEDESYRNAKINKAYSSDVDFREWLNGEMFQMTYQDGMSI